MSTSIETLMLGANVHLLDVKGWIETPVRLGAFYAVHPFVIVQDLTVDCLLGADFLTEHGAVIDCHYATLSLGREIRAQVPLTLGQSGYKPAAAAALVTPPLPSPSSSSPIAIVAPANLEVAGCSVHLLHARLDDHAGLVGGGTGLVEPVKNCQPKHLLVGRTLSQVSSEGVVLLQVLNISPKPIKIYQGMRLGLFTPGHAIFTVSELPIRCTSPLTTLPECVNVDLDSTNLSSSEKQELKSLLLSFSDLFASPTGALG